MDYTIAQDNATKYTIVATLYKGKDAEFVAMLMHNNKFSSYLYFDDKELFSKFSYMYVKNTLKDEERIITGMITIEEVDAEIIEQAIKEIKSYIDAKVSYYWDIFSAIDMYIEYRSPFKKIEAKITDVGNIVELHQGALEVLKEKMDASDDLGIEEVKVVEPFPDSQPKKLSILKRLFNLKGGDDNEK